MLKVSLVWAVSMTAAAIFADVPTALTVEYRTNPVGIDVRAPRLSWKLPAGVKRQTAYALELDGMPSPRIASGETLNNAWTGPALTTGSRHRWRVRVWDEANRPSDWSAPATFTMGVMSSADWKASWIGPHAATRPDVEMDEATWSCAQTALTAVFTLKEIPVSKEIVFLSRAPYELYVNGARSRGSFTGHAWDGRWAKFHDLATDALQVGVNTIEFRPRRPETIVADEDFAVIGVWREKGATVAPVVWMNGRTLGKLRDVAWGRDAILRDEVASPAFEKSFTVDRPVAKATLFITGLGFYEASLNGRRIGEKVLDPSHTDYTKRVLYSTYLLDDEIRKGENTLKVLVGHGFYDVRLKSVWDNDMATWRDFPRMIAQLEIEFADGTRRTVCSDGTWRQVKSPVGWDDIREGEVVGGRHVREPAFPAGGFPVAVVDGPKGRLEAENHPGSRVLYENRPVRLAPVAGEPGAWLAAFPENVAGWVRLRLKGLSAGDVVSIRYDEHVGRDFSPAVPSSFYKEIHGAPTGTFDGPEPRRIDCHFKSPISMNVCARDRGFQTDRFVSAGVGEETYEPRFTYNGFQYVLIRGLKTPLQSDEIVQCVISTDFPSIATFASSEPVLDQLVAAATRTYRANFTMGLPTDCPHREKNGWTGDASVASDFAQFQFENTSAYEKWLRDLVDAQTPAGELPGIVPTAGWGYAWGNGPAWDSALSVVAWNVYRYRDDRRILETAYPALTRYLVYVAANRASPEGLVDWGLEDWIPPEGARVPTREYTSSCFYLQANEIAARMARALGRTAEAVPFEARARQVRAAIRAKYRKANGVFDNGGQTAQSAAIQFGLADAAELSAVGARLVEAVHQKGDHLETGVIGCKTLFRALTKIGRSDLALKVLLQPTAPSPAAWIAKGGANFWEDWGEGASRNHIMFGDVAAWAYEELAGIRLSADARAFRAFEVSPAWTCGLAHVAATVDSPYGKISVAWEANGRLALTVPPGTTCRAVLRDGSRVSVGPGCHIHPYPTF